MRLLLAFLFIVMYSYVSNAQLSNYVSVGFQSNSQYYLDDKKLGNFIDEDRFRSNNYLKVDFTKKSFYLGMQMESYLPQALLNYAPDFKGTNLGLYYAGYKTDKFEITGGHFYEQFGNGLILRSWEDRKLGINNALLGARMKLQPTEYFSLTGLLAKQRVGFSTSKGVMYGFDSAFDFMNMLKSETSSIELGFSYVGRNEDVDIPDNNFNSLTNAYSGRFDVIHKNFYTNAEFVFKSKDAIVQFGKVSNTFIKSGNAFLLNAGYSKKGFGLDATFRRVENMSFYSDREATGNQYNEAILNYIPALTIQHDYALTNIYVYQAQPNVSFLDPSLMKAGEIGGQLDIFYTIKKGTRLGGKYGTKLAINGSYWANLKGDYTFSPFDYKTSFLGFGQKYFSDFNIEIRKKWSRQWSSIFYYVNQFYNKKYVEDTFGQVRANIFVAESTIKFKKGKSFRFELQQLSTNDDKQDWIAGTLEYHFNSKLSIYLLDTYNYGNDNKMDRIHYYNIGGSYSKGANRIALNYGRQRGGLLCVGGVCRYVPQSTGISMDLTSAF